MGCGELYRRSDDRWSFRLKSSDGQTLAVDAGQGYSTKDAARAALEQLLRSDFKGAIGEAATVVCGLEITEDTTLDGDLTCSTGPALVVAADGVTLDLGGFKVSGNPDATGEGPGILLREVTGSTVKNGTVQHFDAGIVIAGGSANVVQDVTAQDNVGSTAGDLGDGIVAINSSQNRIQGCAVQRNGPYSGIALVEASSENLIRGNIVTDNNMLHLGDPSEGRQNMGIRIEGPAANKNKVVGNTIKGSGADGISIHSTFDLANEENTVAKNTSNANGASGRGSGIKLFSTAVDAVSPSRNIIKDNVTDDNTTYGVSVESAGDGVGASENKLIRNKARGNLVYDGHDANTDPPCDANVWDENDLGTVSQQCLRVSTAAAAGQPDPRPA
ncbi:hypothetical protein BH18ACT4_BH18ACT4_03140 [soil metagenome]